ncbi:MAG: hypothetical protein U0821_18795 [Chloroflexota bacterium]
MIRVTTQDELEAALVSTDGGRTATIVVAGQARVTAYGQAVVTAYGQAVVTASDQARVYAYDQAVVTAYGQAVVYASDQARVYASEYCVVYVYSDSVACDGPGHVIRPPSIWEVETWAAVHGVRVSGGRLYAYKALDGALQTGHAYDSPTTYVPGTDVAPAKWDPSPTCGDGLHLSPHPHLARRYRMDAERWVLVSAAVSDCVVVEPGPHADKIKAKLVHVEYEVSEFGEPMESREASA